MRLNLAVFLFIFSSTLLANNSKSPSIPSGTIDKPILLGGSSSVAQLLRVIQPIFENEVEQVLHIRSVGSDMGIKAIAENLVDIGASSRYLTKFEQEKWPHLKQVIIAQDALVFFVNKATSIDNLTTEQLADIYSGKVTHWSDVSPKVVVTSSQDDVIGLFSKDVNHGTFDIFLEFLNLAYLKDPGQDTIKLKKAGNHGVFSSSDIMLYSQFNQALGIVQRLPNAIAYDSFGAASKLSNDKRIDQINFLSINNIKPNNKTIKNGQYNFVRPLVILINTHSQRSVKKAHTLLKFLNKSKTKQLLSENNYIMMDKF